MEGERIVEVAVPLPVDETFDYALAASQGAEPGTRVLVPHGGRRLTGVVVAERDPSEAQRSLRRVLRDSLR